MSEEWERGTSRCRSWLILDNADDLELAREFLPQDPQGPSTATNLKSTFASQLDSFQSSSANDDLQRSRCYKGGRELQTYVSQGSVQLRAQ